MKITEKRIENSQAYLTVELEESEVNNSLERAYKRLVQSTDIPGFRRGKAPRDVLETFLGKDRLMEDALNNFLPEACFQLMKFEDIAAVAEPYIKVTNTNPVVFEAIFPLAPSVKLGDYRSINMAPEVVAVKDEDVDWMIEYLRHQQATWEAVDRAVAARDLVTIDVESTVEGAPFVSGKGVEYLVVEGSKNPAPGFAEALIGLHSGEEKEFSLKLPEDFSNKEQAGKEATFKVKVISVKEEKLPELDTNFVKSVAPDLEDLSSLKERIEENMTHQLEDKAMSDFEDRLLDEIVKISEVEFPPFIVENEIDYLLQRQSEEWQRYPADVQESLRTMPEAKLRENLRPMATKRVAHLLVIYEFVKAENIEVNEAEIDLQISHMTGSEESRKAIDTPENREVIRRYILRRKAMEQLMAMAQNKPKDEEAQVSPEGDAPKQQETQVAPNSANIEDNTNQT
jgi:trigger factor